MHACSFRPAYGLPRSAWQARLSVQPSSADPRQVVACPHLALGRWRCHARQYGGRARVHQLFQGLNGSRSSPGAGRKPAQKIGAR